MEEGGVEKKCPTLVMKGNKNVGKRWRLTKKRSLGEWWCHGKKKGGMKEKQRGSV